MMSGLRSAICETPSSDAPWLWVMHPSEPLRDASVGMVSRTEAGQFYATQRESRLDEIVR